MTRISRDAFAFLSGVFLLCMSVLMIQIVQTRMISVVSLYYMAFFSISMAMLGLTGGALIVYYKLDKVNPGNVNAFLSRISTAFALCIAGCFVLELASPCQAWHGRPTPCLGSRPSCCSRHRSPSVVLPCRSP